MAAGVRALDAAWGGPAMAKKSPRRESPCKPSLAFWGQGMGVGEILGCHFFFFQWQMGMAQGEHVELCSSCSATLSFLPPLSFRLCSH